MSNSQRASYGRKRRRRWCACSAASLVATKRSIGFGEFAKTACQSMEGNARQEYGDDKMDQCAMVRRGSEECHRAYRRDEENTMPKPRRQKRKTREKACRVHHVHWGSKHGNGSQLAQNGRKGMRTNKNGYSGSVLVVQDGDITALFNIAVWKLPEKLSFQSRIARGNIVFRRPYQHRARSYSSNPKISRRLLMSAVPDPGQPSHGRRGAKALFGYEPAEVCFTPAKRKSAPKLLLSAA